MAKQEYEVAFSQANTPKKKKDTRICQKRAGYYQKRILDCQQTQNHYIETFWRAGLTLLLLFPVPGTSVLYR